MDRYRYLCERLHDGGADVCQFVTTFDHARKRRKSRDAELPWRRISVFEPGYSRNVSIRRLISHGVFDSLVPLYFLREAILRGAPDTILAVLPHNGAACAAAAFARLIRARFVVDVHDTWPESILSVTQLNPLTRLGYRAWKLLADIALVAADEAFGESVQYAARADSVRSAAGRSSAKAVYLGGDVDYYEAIQPPSVLPPEIDGATFLVSYAGTLGENYDLDCMLDAFALFQAETPEAGLLLLGTGEREADMRARIASLQLKAWVSGRLPHPTLVSYLKRSHVGMNCFKRGGNVAYSYKLNDYLLAGAPVVNSLPGESAEFLVANGLGVNYVPGDSRSLLEALRSCRERWARDPDWDDHVRAFSSRMLDRRATYRPLIDACLPGVHPAASAGAP
jgi:glycosyltransferase involved in cell wall biosynthesis